MMGEVDDGERAALEHGMCPDCAGRGFVIGPVAGGGIQPRLTQINIECASLSCRARFNVAFYAGGVIHAHRIETRAQGGLTWPSEPLQ